MNNNAALLLLYVGRGRCPEHLGAQCQGSSGLLNSLTVGLSDSTPSAVSANQLQHGLNYFLSFFRNLVFLNEQNAGLINGH